MNYNNSARYRRMPLRPACELHEDDPIIPQSKPQKEVLLFPSKHISFGYSQYRGSIG